MTTPPSPANALSPAVTLATSMHAQPGVYAILLGSGVSTAAGMPTGWGVVTELVRRVAAAGAPAEFDAAARAAIDPERWWQDTYGQPLGYSTLLEQLAPTSAARQGLLADFFEPNDDDRATGRKTPTSAHRAVADLVRRGYVRVIVTTNFDRLIEQALSDAGVAAQVVSRPDAVAGMTPLTHAAATLVKLHGNYLDIGSRNTVDELSTYPDAWRSLLRQVFDEYGFVISGWSADWDTALVDALETTVSRRYPLYWDRRSSRGPTAQQLIANRRISVLPDDTADELFTGLVHSLDALERLAEPPLTTAIAIQRLKRYLPNPIHRIDLADLVLGRIDPIAAAVDRHGFHLPDLTDAAVDELYDDYLTVSRPLLDLLVVGVTHDVDDTHLRLWRDVLHTGRSPDAAPGATGHAGQCPSPLLRPYRHRPAARPRRRLRPPPTPLTRRTRRRPWRQSVLRGTGSPSTTCWSTSAAAWEQHRS